MNKERVIMVILFILQFISFNYFYQIVSPYTSASDFNITIYKTYLKIYIGYVLVTVLILFLISKKNKFKKFSDNISSLLLLSIQIVWLIHISLYYSILK